MREDAAAFKQKVEAELDAQQKNLDEQRNRLDEQRARLDEQRTRLDEQRAGFAESLGEFVSRYGGKHKFDAGFSETVVEHLRLARDEGAKVAANALAEAEGLRQEEVAPPPAADFGKLNDAIKEISSQTSQATILKSLVSYAGEYADRGAFFIVKNEHFIGWKTLDESDDEAILDIEFPASSSSLLAKAVDSLSTAQGAYDPDSEDRAFLEPLRFGQPDGMYAIPLVARGRGVAVLYVDKGAAGRTPDIGALEALVRVAGMTVELQAAAATASQASAPAPAPEAFEAPSHEEAPAFETNRESFEPVPETDFSFTEAAPEAETVEAADSFTPRGFEPETVEEVSEPAVADDAEEFAEEVSEPAEVSFEDLPDAAEEVSEPAPAPEPEFEASPFTVPSAPAFVDTAVIEPPIAPVVVEAPRARLSDRNVDLPIEVAEDERRLHNDARRFARLLVSEIKLYNEQKVKEGRDANDLYDRLREAIDRSREMYDKRVQPPVAAKFDYFNYELVNSLADGEASRLGSSYPGAAV